MGGAKGGAGRGRHGGLVVEACVPALEGFRA